MAKVTELSKYAQAKKTAKPGKPAARGGGKSAAAKAAAARSAGPRNGAPAGARDIDHFIKTAGLDTRREKEIGQRIGYHYDVRLLRGFGLRTPCVRRYMFAMCWSGL